MAGLFPWWNRYPFVNDEELNLDWILSKIKELDLAVTDFINLNTIKYADPILWDITSQYEANTVVIDPQTGDAYISTTAVPYGVSLGNTDYWTKIFNYQDALNVLMEQIAAANERLSTTATAARSEGDLVWLDGLLYIVIAPMIAGDSYVVDSNIVKCTIEMLMGNLFDLNTNSNNSLVDAINSSLQYTDDTNTRLKEQISSHDEGMSTIASANRIKGDLVWYQNYLYVVTTSISAGSPYVVGTNITPITIEGLLGNLDALNTSDKSSVIAAINASLQYTDDVNTKFDNHLKWGLNFSRCIFLGDSYMETAYLSDSQGFVNQFCSYLGITNYTKYGMSGSGFINDGGSGGHGTYLQILQNNIIPNEANPNEVTFILVEGGANDGAPTYETYTTVVQTWIAAAKAAFPNAKIAVMETPTFDVILNNTRLGLKRACQLSQEVFIDSGLWLVGNTGYEATSPNLDHPNANGCKVIAQNLFNTMIGSQVNCYFDTVLQDVSDADITLNTKRFNINGDTLTIFVAGGLNNKATRYVEIAQYPEHFYNHLPRFEGCANTGLGQVYPVWLTQQKIYLDTLVSTSKSTDFSFAITTSIMGLFGTT